MLLDRNVTDIGMWKKVYIDKENVQLLGAKGAKVKVWNMEEKFIGLFRSGQMRSKWRKWERALDFWEP